jgi:hypothetical protein
VEEGEKERSIEKDNYIGKGRREAVRKIAGEKREMQGSR